MRKIVFGLVTLPKGAVFGCFCTFILIVFLCSSFSEEPSNGFTSIFCGRCWYHYESISLKSPFHSVSPSAGSHFEVFWGLLGCVLVFFKSCFILSYKILYSRCLCYSDSQWAKKKLTAFLSLLGLFCSFLVCLFWGFLACCGYSPLCLEKDKTFCCRLSALQIIGYFWSIF